MLLYGYLNIIIDNNGATRKVLVLCYTHLCSHWFHFTFDANNVWSKSVVM